MKNRKRSVSSIIFVMVIVVSLLVPGLTVNAGGPENYKINVPDIISVGDSMYAYDRDISDAMLKLSSSGSLQKYIRTTDIASDILEYKGKLYYTEKNLNTRYLSLICYDTKTGTSSLVSDKIIGYLAGVTDWGCVINNNGKFSCCSSNGTRTVMKGTAGMNFIASNNRYAFFAKMISTTKEGGIYTKKYCIYRYSMADNKLSKIKYLTYKNKFSVYQISVSGYVFDNNNIVFGLNFWGDQYSDAYFMKADGSGFKKICERTGSVPYTCNNYVYFRLENGNSVKVYQNGAVKTLISKDGGTIIGQNTKNQYVVLRNNFSANAELYVYNSLSEAPLRSLAKLHEKAVSGKVTLKQITVNGMSGDVLLVTDRIETDSYEYVGFYIINSRTGKSTLISNYTKLNKSSLR